MGFFFLVDLKVIRRCCCRNFKLWLYFLYMFVIYFSFCNRENINDEVFRNFLFFIVIIGDIGGVIDFLLGGIRGSFFCEERAKEVVGIVESLEF